MVNGWHLKGDKLSVIAKCFVLCNNTVLYVIQHECVFWKLVIIHQQGMQNVNVCALLVMKQNTSLEGHIVILLALPATKENRDFSF